MISQIAAAIATVEILAMPWLAVAAGGGPNHERLWNMISGGLNLSFSGSAVRHYHPVLPATGAIATIALIDQHSTSSSVIEVAARSCFPPGSMMPVITANDPSAQAFLVKDILTRESA